MFLKIKVIDSKCNPRQKVHWLFSDERVYYKIYFNAANTLAAN